MTATGVNSIVRTLTCAPIELGSPFPVGTTKETCTATDGHENKATGEFEVEVTKKGGAPVAPAVVTSAASSVGETAATLNGSVNPNGFEVTECEFEYGTSTSYGKTAPCSALPGSGSSAVSVSAALTGLSAGTTYDYRLVAKNSGGQTKGSNETFKTSAKVVTPVAPAVVTSAASSVGETAATLNGSVNPNGFEVTECEFEYGTSTSYGKTAPCSALPGSGSSAVSVSAALTGLSAGTTYDYRLVAKNSGGQTKGSNETFKTSAKVVTPVAPAVVTSAASSVGETAATLNGSVNPNGFEVTECEFEYGTSTSYGKTAPCSALPGSGSSAVSVSAALTGLSAGTTYDYRLVAKNSGGQTKGSNETFKTSAKVVTPVAPAVVTSAASSVGETAATLNGSVNPNGFEVTECEFEYGTSTSYGKTAPCSALPGSGSSAVSVSAALTGLSAGTTYDYRLVAKNSGGQTKGSNETFKTSAKVVTPVAPAVVTSAASSVGETAATLNGSVNPNGFEVTECEFEYGTSTSYGKTAPCSALPGSGSSAVSVSAALTGLSAGTTYDYRLVAKNSGGQTKGSNETFKTSAKVVTPVAPAVVTSAASSVGETAATLNGSVNPNGFEVTECEFEYGTSTSYGKTAPCSALPGSGSSAVSVSAALTGLSAGTTYDYRLVAKNSGGQTKGSNETFKTSAKVVTPVAPAVVTSAASSVGETAATLNGSVNPNGFEVTECEFEYGTSTSYGKTAPCSALPGSGSSAVSVSAALTGLSAGTTYDYRLVAKNSGGQTKGSNETFKTSAKVVTPVAPAVVTSAASSVGETAATLNGSVNPNGFEVTECEFEYGTSTSYGKTAPCSALPGSGSSAVSVSAALTGLSAGTTYDYRLVAKNSGGQTKGSNETFKTSAKVVTPVAPAVVTSAASSVGETAATLNGSVNPNGFEVTECEFEYGTSTSYGKTAPCSALPGSGSSAVSVSAALTGLSAGTTYDYRLVAKNSGGQTKGSNETFKTSAKVVTPVAPAVVTSAASSVGETAATLNGSVNPNGFEVTECEFEYGTSTSYGKTAPCSALPGSGSSAVSVSAALTGLSAGTTYDYRLVAKNSGGQTKGSNETFKTSAKVVTPVAPAVVTSAASSVGETAATLNGSVNPNGFEVTECEFEYGTSTSYGKTAPCSALPGSGSSAVSVSAALTGLSAGTTYDYRLVAKNSGGQTKGSNETFKTSAKVVTPVAPAVVTSAASSVGETAATLNGSVNPNGFEVTECEFEYGTSTSYGKTAPCSALPGSGSSAVSVSAALTGLSAGTTYDYRLVAKNSGGQTKGSNETFKTSGGGTSAPTPEANIRQLLNEVSAAGISRGIRNELSGLLEYALRNLKAPRGFGGGPSGFGSYRELSDALQANSATPRCGYSTRQAFEDLEQFIAVIARDQSRRRPQIPRGLASAWSQSARSIAASLSCGSVGKYGYSDGW